jgi:hypothetical protein
LEQAEIPLRNYILVTQPEKGGYPEAQSDCQGEIAAEPA